MEHTLCRDDPFEELAYWRYAARTALDSARPTWGRYAPVGGMGMSRVGSPRDEELQRAQRVGGEARPDGGG